MRYSWKVVAVDNDGGIKESDTWSFTTNSENSPPEEFSLVEPLDNAVLNILIRHFVGKRQLI